MTIIPPFSMLGITIVLSTAVLFIAICRWYLRLGYTMCDPNISMTGKVVIVTGSNTGIGFHAAKDLASRGARVILACRSEKNGLAAREDIVSQTGNPNVVFRTLDLLSLASVREFAEEVLKTEGRLDVLINNAGVYGHNWYTDDNILGGMQTNHFGPFLLTNLLLPLLKKSAPSRIVNVSSILHFLGEVKVNLLNKENYYGDLRTYSNSKLCNVLFTMELSRRLKGCGVVANSVHPGIIKTNIVKDRDLIASVMWFIWCWLCCKTAEEGAQPLIYLATAPECADVSGAYYVNCAKAMTLGIAKDTKIAADLWQLSEQLVELN